MNLDMNSTHVYSHPSLIESWPSHQETRVEKKDVQSIKFLITPRYKRFDALKFCHVDLPDLDGTGMYCSLSAAARKSIVNKCGQNIKAR